MLQTAPLAVAAVAALLLSPVTAQSLCPTNPSDPACSTYTLPDTNASASLTNLCSQMPYMVGCSLASLCKQSPTSAPAAACTPFSLLADVCAADMPGMSACSNYGKMCGNSSVALPATAPAQCRSSPALASLPSTMTATAQISSICNEMPMTGCDACQIRQGASFPSNNCDVLGTYALLCQAMPGMSQCGQWAAMCASNPALSYCATGDSSSAPPLMRMFFHTGLADYVLFESWVPRTNGQFTGAFIAIFLAAFLYEGYLAYNALLEASWAKSVRTFPGTDDAPAPASLLKERLVRAGIRFASRFIGATAAYALMLITMTFNVGLFFAVVVGLAVGSAVFADVVRQGENKGVEIRDNLCC
ncbi:Ctr copper transporter family-domain-containing protein [Blyttiomyces helicus]|uniref:Copper transport protein n=1 Tax=Blyttiomyces helicus TaxID=388810 RepID=A0A4P9WI84_9FUNG|nr:Ctr copper transporter family-domain-containing protein [Blyttiomyces helicus]|eukprot:RKO91583.1 Ctr copper transporter family-domain-containing protein [Blyttiomyces helicus]